MNALKDYYHILGLEKSAEPEQIKKAYRKLAVKYHPDHNHGDKAAEEKFKEISEAYAVLIDPSKRAQYDRAQATGEAKQADPGEGFGYTQEEIFKEVFRNAQMRQAFQEIFRRTGIRFDEQFFDQVFFGGRGFFFGGVYFNGSKSGRVHRDNRPDYRTSFSQEARAGRRKATPTIHPVKPAKKGILARLTDGVKKFARETLSLPMETEQANGDINFNLPITRRQAREGAEIQISYNRQGKTQTVSVKIPPGAKEGTRLRLKKMGAIVNNVPGDLYLNIRYSA